MAVAIWLAIGTVIALIGCITESPTISGIGGLVILMLSAVASF